MYSYGDPTPPIPWALQLQDDGSALAYAIDRLTLAEPGSAVRIEGFHDDNGVWDVALLGLAHCTELEPARRALNIMLRAVPDLQQAIRDGRGRKAFYTTETFITAVHELYRQADAEGWDLSDSGRCPAEWIGDQLKPHGLPERTLRGYLRPLGGLEALRERRI